MFFPFWIWDGNVFYSDSLALSCLINMLRRRYNGTDTPDKQRKKAFCFRKLRETDNLHPRRSIYTHWTRAMKQKTALQTWSNSLLTRGMRLCGRTMENSISFPCAAQQDFHCLTCQLCYSLGFELRYYVTRSLSLFILWLWEQCHCVNVSRSPLFSSLYPLTLSAAWPGEQWK